MINIYWPYINSFSISDQLFALRSIFFDQNIPCSFSNKLDPLSTNIFIECFNHSSSEALSKFYETHNKKVIISVSELFTFNNCLADSTINGKKFSEWEKSPPFEDPSDFRYRFKFLYENKHAIGGYISLFPDPPSLDSYGKLSSCRNLFNLGNPNYECRQSSYPEKQFKYDLYFSGSLTDFRKAALHKLKNDGYSIYIETEFVSEKKRIENLGLARFNLNLPQHEKWIWPSSARIAFGQINGKFNVTPEFIHALHITNELFSLPKFNEFRKFYSELRPISINLQAATPWAKAEQAKFIEYITNND